MSFIERKMFGVFKELGKKVAAIDEHRLLEEILSEEILKAQIIDLNQEQLYEKGVQADGTPTGDYAPVTKYYYKPLAASQGRDGRTDHITGKDTGQTYASMKVANELKGFKVIADDRNDFFEREPKGLGLTTENINEIIPEVREKLIEKVKKKIFA